ncbi:MAG: hypothetical protein EBQ82_13025 [Betaproteobacteria bacterium]|nr:hypothetical protein [Betaproteobacteria bacterium]NBY06279.1 hypothetical protein [Betaproteobacteria bacterium]
MNCLQCHNPLPVTANFCGKCGTTVPGKNKKPMAQALDAAHAEDAPEKEEGIDLLAYVKHQKALIPGQTTEHEVDAAVVKDHVQTVPAPKAPAREAAVGEAAVQLMDDLRAQIDAVGVSAPVHSQMLPREFVPSAATAAYPVPAPHPAPVASANLSPELAAHWQDMMQSLQERMDALAQQIVATAESNNQLEPMRAWHDVQDVLEVQGRQLQDLMGQVQGLAANEQVQALSEQIKQWQADNEKARQAEAPKIPQMQSNLVAYQNEQMQALGQLQQELRAFALAGAQSAGRLMAIEQAVSQLQSRLGVQPGHAVPPVTSIAAASPATAASTQVVVSEPLEKVERVTPSGPKSAWVNALMVGAVVVVLVLTAVLAGMAVYNFMSYSSLKATASVKAKPERAEHDKDAHP